MWELTCPGYEAHKTLTILSGERACYTCGKPREVKHDRLCKNCHWHYRRAKYHAVYHYALRARLIEMQEGRNYRINDHTPCRKCKQFYFCQNPSEYASRPNTSSEHPTSGGNSESENA